MDLEKDIINLYQACSSDMISMDMSIHGIYELQAQFFDKSQISVHSFVYRIN